jgi:hypothetical protein
MTRMKMNSLRFRFGQPGRSRILGLPGKSIAFIALMSATCATSGFAQGVSAGLLRLDPPQPAFIVEGGELAASRDAYARMSEQDMASFCAQRFSSYDPRSGTYLGRDGRRHRCP